MPLSKVALKLLPLKGEAYFSTRPLFTPQIQLACDLC